MTSVAFVSPAHGRFAVTDFVLAQRARLIRELAGRGIDGISIIVAEDENLEIARAHGCQTVESPNLPLGRKCNLGLGAAAREAEHVVWIGSDDWIHPDAFKPLERASRQRRIIVGRRLAIVDMRRGRLQRVATPSKYGAIPWIIDSRLLRPHAEFVREDLNHGLDGALIRGLRRARRRFQFVFDDPHEFRAVDFKSAESITPYSGLAKHLGTRAEEPAWQTLARWFPADLVEQAHTTAAGLPRNGRRYRTPAQLAPPPRRKKRKAMKMIDPATGGPTSVSRAGAKVLRARGWLDVPEAAL